MGNLGGAYYNLGDIQSALKYFEMAIAIRREIGDSLGLAMVSYNTALLYANQGELIRAVRLLEEAERIFNEIGNQTRRQSAQQLLNQIKDAMDGR